MAGEKNIKLFKIASEINIGKDAIVDYLQSKGYDIQNKPTAVLNEHMVEVILDKFKREKRAADIQREKIQKHKDLRQEPKTAEEKKKEAIPEIKAPVKEVKKEVVQKEQIPVDKPIVQVEPKQIVEDEPKVIKEETKPEAKVTEVKPVVVEERKLPEVDVPVKHVETEVKEKPVEVQKPADIQKPAEVLKPVEVKIEPQVKEAEVKVSDAAEKAIKEEPRAVRHDDKPKDAPSKSETAHEVKTVVQREEKKAERPRHPEHKSDDNRRPEHRKQDFKREDFRRDDQRKEDFKREDSRRDDTRRDDTRRDDTRRGDNRRDDGRKTEKSGEFRKDDQRRPEQRKDDHKRFDSKRDENRKQDNFRDDNRPNRQPSEQKPYQKGEFDRNRQDKDRNRFGGDQKQKPSQQQSQQPRQQFRDDDSERYDKNKKKKRFGEEGQAGETPQLRGLTVIGKIDIKSEKDQPPKKDRRFGDAEKSGDGKDKGKAKQFKKRKHPSEILGSIQDIVKEADNKFKAKEKDKKEVIDREEKKKKKRKKTIREMISQDEVNRAIRETLAGMDVAHTASQRTKMKLKKRAEREEKELRLKEELDLDNKILKLSEFVTTSDLASLLGITPSDIILKCMNMGIMVTINQRLDKDTIFVIADDYGFQVDFLDEKEAQFVEVDSDDEESLKPRPPIVTIMGHVDHGKTSLLDFIRKANVVAGEKGGITQHIGAYNVELPNGKSITFLDTPGHEAFTAMRARGAQVTDIVVLVVAADDSVMPQTIEAISHAKAANVPIVVAINKIDKADSNPDRIKQQLSDQGVLIEEWGGKYQSVELSAKKGINVDLLLDKILLEAELLELKANPDRLARGIVIESNMRLGFGSVATIIVQKGTLKIGDTFVSGINSGRIRALLDERENKVEFATPGDPIVVSGFDGLPEAGDSFMVTKTEQEAKQIANERKQLRREQEMRQVRHVTLDEISAQIQLGGVKELNLVLKGDVAGSVEALSDSLLRLSRDEVRVNILHKGFGNITETDVMLAAASGAVVIGFNVVPTNKAKKAAEAEMVDIRHYNIIYDCINEIQLALEGLLTPEYKEEITSTVEIRKTFKTSKYGTIAGCYVTNGKVTRNDRVRILRDGFKEFEGTIASLKRNKDDVKEVETGFECGIQLNGFNDVNVGDILESFKVVEIKRKFV